MPTEGLKVVTPMTGLCVVRPKGNFKVGDRIPFTDYPGAEKTHWGTVIGIRPCERRYDGKEWESIFIDEDRPGN